MEEVIEELKRELAASKQATQRQLEELRKFKGEIQQISQTKAIKWDQMRQDFSWQIFNTHPLIFFKLNRDGERKAKERIWAF